jgi:hypothetical protein
LTTLSPELTSIGYPYKIKKMPRHLFFSGI